MGYNLGKRISLLKQQTEDDLSGRWGFSRLFILSVIALLILRFTILPTAELPSSKISEEEEESENTVDYWRQDLEFQYTERVQWLDNSYLVLTPGAADLYREFSQYTFNLFPTESPEEDPEDLAVIDLDGVLIWLSRFAVGTLLRLGFIVLAFWPYWVLPFVLAYLAIRWENSRPRSETMLGVLHKGNGPFYSGIYGPYRPNDSYSGTDLSCPGLACPPFETRKKTLSHPLAQLLKKQDAFTETALGLLQIILAHADFPGIVEEENSSQEAVDLGSSGPDAEKVSKTGFVSNAAKTLITSTEEGLPAVLEAHARIKSYIRSIEAKGHKSNALNKNYPMHAANIEKLCQGLTPIGSNLVRSLTPNRMWAMGQLPPTLVAVAYLAIEAGKSLVYKRHGNTFSRISLFPHLQARAVIQSLPHFHKEFTGDPRLIIRQALISSRRHGDFARAFLPIKMPLESRALRDWLEVLYAEPEKRDDTSNIVELDGHIEEVGVNWKAGFAQKVRQHSDAAVKDEVREHPLWQGLPYKSVVLIPMLDVVEIALRGIHEARLARIGSLLLATRKYQTRIGVSARLPGFKRQAVDIDKTIEDADPVLQGIAKKARGTETIERWRIVRRMLTKYNWLSTRVGDDAVPLVGLVQAALNTTPNAAPGQGTIVGIDALAPLRQRRFAELFGKNWEVFHYRASPTPEDIEVFVDNEIFGEFLRVKKVTSGIAQSIENTSEASEVSEITPNLADPTLPGISKSIASA